MSFRPPRKTRGLTPRERSVMRLLAVGCSVNQITDRLQLSTSHIEKVVTKLRRKFKVDSVRELPIRAFAIGLVDPEVCRLLGHTRPIQDLPFVTPLPHDGHNSKSIFFNAQGPEGDSIEDE